MRHTRSLLPSEHSMSNYDFLHTNPGGTEYLPVRYAALRQTRL